MTNFVIVYCLPAGAQAQVLHGRRGAAVGILSGPYSTLYRFRRVPRGGRRQDLVSAKCIQPLSTGWLELGKLLPPELVLWPLCA